MTLLQLSTGRCRCWLSATILLLLTLATLQAGSVVSAGPTYTVSQELGIDALGYVLVQDGVVRGASTIITVRLDLMAVPTSLTQYVTFTRTTFYDGSSLYLRGPNRAAANSSLMSSISSSSSSTSSATVATYIVVRDCTFYGGGSIIVSGSLAATVLLIENSAWREDILPPTTSFGSSIVNAYLSTSAQQLELRPRVLFANVAMANNSAFQCVDTVFFLPIDGVAFVVDSGSSSSTGSGFSLSANAGVILRGCTLHAVASNVGAMWLSLSAMVLSDKALFEVSSCTISISAGARAVGIALAVAHFSSSAASSSASSCGGVVILQGILFDLTTSTTGTATAVDMSTVSFSSSSVLMLLWNTVSLAANSNCDALYSALIVLPGYSAFGKMSLVRNVNTDSSAGGSTCTAFATVMSGSAAFSSSSSRVYSQCNTYNGVTWTGYPAGSGTTYLLTTAVCSATCFDGLCANFVSLYDSSSGTCSCQCTGAAEYGSMCMGVNLPLLLDMAKTFTKTKTSVITLSPRNTLTRSEVVSSSFNVDNKASRSASASYSVGVPSGSRTISVSRHSHSKDESYTPRSVTPTYSWSISESALLASPTETRTPTPSMSPTRDIKSMSRTESVSGSTTSSPSKNSASFSPQQTDEKTLSFRTVSVTRPTPSSDMTVTETDTLTRTRRSKTITGLRTHTHSLILTPSVTLSASQQITSSNSVMANRGLQLFPYYTRNTWTLSTTMSMTLSTSSTVSMSELRTQILVVTHSLTPSRASKTLSQTNTTEASTSASATKSKDSITPSSTYRITPTLSYSVSLVVPSKTTSASSMPTITARTFSVSDTSSITPHSGSKDMTDTTTQTQVLSNSTTLTSSRSRSIDESQSRSVGTRTQTPSSTWSRETPTAASSGSVSDSVTVEAGSRSGSYTPTSSSSLSLSLSMSRAFRRSMSVSESQELASMTFTKKHVPTKTISLSKDRTNTWWTATVTEERSSTLSLHPTPSMSSSTSDTSTDSGSLTITVTKGSRTLSFTRKSWSYQASDTVTTPASTTKDRRSHTDSLTSSGTASATITILYSAQAQSETRTETISISQAARSASITFTDSVTQSSATSQSGSVNRNAVASSTLLNSSSQSVSPTISINRHAHRGNFLQQLPDAAVSFSVSFSSSRSFTRTVSQSQSSSVTDSLTHTRKSPSIPLSDSASRSSSREKSASAASPSTTDSFSGSTTPMQSASVTPTRASPSVMETASFSVSISRVTQSLSTTIRRSFSRRISRSRSVSSSRTVTISLRLTPTRTYFVPLNNFAAMNLFARFQAEASTCVQLAVYILVPVGLLLAGQLMWCLWHVWKHTRITVDTYRAVSQLRSLFALHTYLSMFYPCHHRCAMIHSLGCMVHMATWTCLLLFFMERFVIVDGGGVSRAAASVITLMVAQSLKPVMNLASFYFCLDEAEDAYDPNSNNAGGGGFGIFGGEAAFDAVDDDHDADEIAFDIDDDERERLQVTAPREKEELVQKKEENEDDLNILDDISIQEDDIDFGEDGIDVAGDAEAKEEEEERRTAKEKKKKHKQSKKEKKRNAEQQQEEKKNKKYGFGELDHFVLFHDDFESVDKRGQHLRLQHFADEHAQDSLVHHTTGEDGAATDTAAAATDQREPKNGSRSPTSTSSCISIEVDDYAEFGGILPNQLGHGGDMLMEKDDDEMSISDPRTLRTLHIPLLAVLIGLLAIELFVINGHYRLNSRVCNDWLFTLWWITWIFDFFIGEPLYLLAVALFRFLIREPHEEDILGNPKVLREDSGGKRDLRWWRGNLLHPYDGETRYR